MVVSIENCLELINDDGGFTVVGQCKRGLINNKSLIGNENTNGSYCSNGNYAETQIDAGDISHHFVQFIPSDRNFLDPETELCKELKTLKYDVSRIQS